MHTPLLAAAALLFNAAQLTAAAATTIPLSSRSSPPSEVGDPCGQELGDCAGDLTCIPLSTDCTIWGENSEDGCPGTCQIINLDEQRIYTVCGGWHLYDDCDERVERCVADPRRYDRCGPSCDGPGICHPFAEVCGLEGDPPCPEGTVCFDSENGGRCFPLRFGSDTYEKTRAEEIVREDQDGWQGD